MPGDPTAIDPPHGHAAIGRLGRVFQLEGGIRLIVTDPRGSAALDSVERVFVVGFGAAGLRRVRRHREALVLYLEGVRDRETAATLTGAEVYVTEAALAQASPDAAAGVDPAALTGLPLWVDGLEVGRVLEVRFAALNPVLVVTTAQGEVMLPLAAPYVTVDAAGVTLVDPPEGLLEPA